MRYAKKVLCNVINASLTNNISDEARLEEIAQVVMMPNKGL
jgi:hypothetical protein